MEKINTDLKKYFKKAPDLPINLPPNLCSKIINIYRLKELSDDRKTEEFILKETLNVISAAGIIYNTCVKNSCEFISKWVPGNTLTNLKECIVQAKLSLKNLAPKIYLLIECTNGILIVMDKLKYTVLEELMELNDSQIKLTVKNFKDKNEFKLPENELENIKTIKDIVKIQDKFIFPNGSIENFKKCLEKMKNSVPGIKYNIIENLKNISDVKRYAYQNFPLNYIDIIGDDSENEKKHKIKILMEVQKLLENVHKLKISHGDPHLENFMNGKDEKYYMIDFGLSEDPAGGMSRSIDFYNVLRRLKNIIELRGYKNLKYLAKFFLNYNKMNIYVSPFLEKNEIRKYNKLLKSKTRTLSPDAKKYLEKHPVIFSMTTSPIRLRKIGVALSLILNFPYTKEIHINLPVLYRNKEPYDKADIDFIQHMSDKIKIFRVEKDIGPLTKILPTIERLQKKRNNDITISVDDDTGYDQKLLYELSYYSYAYPKCVFTGSGFNLSRNFSQDEIYWNFPAPKNIPKGLKGAKLCDVVEGFGGIAYRPNLFNIDLVLKMNSISIPCKLSDDLTLSAMLEADRVPKYYIENAYYKRSKDMYQFKYGFMGDALHQGSGLDAGNVHDANFKKYAICMKQMYEAHVY